MNKTYLLTVFILLALSISACARGGGRQAGVGLDVTEVMREPTVAVTAAPVAEVVATEPPASAMPPASATAPATFTPLATATVAASPTLAATATPDPYAGLTIADLRARTYGEGELRVEETIHVTDAFTRTLVSYPSDGLQVYGFMNVPFGEGPFPVALVLHGYIPPRQYGTIGYTTRYADWLARAGYLVLHPNYRNHPPSDETPAFATGADDADFRIGYAVDVMNLMALLEKQGGQPGPLQQADASQMHLLGHSMGGGMTLRILTVYPGVDAAVLYGSMSGDEVKNYEQIQIWSNGQSGARELATSPEDMQRIAPAYFYQDIEAAVAIHHGELDDTVPLAWSVELCQELQALQKQVECFTYPDQPHTFRDEGDRLFIQRVIDFFARH